MITPKSLYKGARIAIVAPASCMKVVGEEREEKLKQLVQVLADIGLEAVLYPTCRSGYGYLGGTDEERAKDIMDAFTDPTIDGIFCLRGGYGVQRMLDLLDLDTIKENPKWFAGYSDITALHMTLNQKCDMVTYHAPMPSTEMITDEYDAYTKEWLEKAMFGGLCGELPSYTECETMNGGRAEGMLCGGNLSLIAASLGTPFELDTKDKILFLEDVGELPYRIDGMINHLRLAGKFEDCAGIVMGYYTNCEPEETSMTLKQIFKDLLPKNKPVILNYSCGHQMPTMTLPLGKMAAMDADAKTLTIR